MKPLEDKVIWITGALGSLGLPAVRMFLERGAAIYASDLKAAADAVQMLDLISEYGNSRVIYGEADLTEEHSVIEAVLDIESRFGRLDGAYHTVYSNVWKPALELTLDEWEYSLRGTLTSTFLVNKHAIKLMIKHGGGSIVNTSSILGEIVSPGALAYGASKAAMNHFTRIIASDYGDRGIRANVLVPGDFRMKEVLPKQSASERENMRKLSFLGRSGSSDEVNEVACFLLSDAASYVTGGLFHVDGGFHQ